MSNVNHYESDNERRNVEAIAENNTSDGALVDNSRAITQWKQTKVAMTMTVTRWTTNQCRYVVVVENTNVVHRRVDTASLQLGMPIE